MTSSAVDRRRVPGRYTAALRELGIFAVASLV
jgi:hypothetical protein